MRHGPSGATSFTSQLKSPLRTAPHLSRAPSSLSPSLSPPLTGRWLGEAAARPRRPPRGPPAAPRSPPQTRPRPAAPWRAACHAGSAAATCLGTPPSASWRATLTARASHRLSRHPLSRHPESRPATAIPATARPWWASRPARRRGETCLGSGREWRRARRPAKARG